MNTTPKELDRYNKDRVAAKVGLSRQEYELMRRRERAAKAGLSLENHENERREELAKRKGFLTSNEYRAAQKKARRAGEPRPERERVSRGDASGSGTSGRSSIVPLTSEREAIERSWNRGERFSIPGSDHIPQYFEVTRDRQGGEKFRQGDFRRLLIGG
jgi:hypothetical protein